MKEYNSDMSILVLSCDKYGDLWDDFFSLKEKFWADCSFQTYLVNNVAAYKRSNVTVINCGNELNWVGRLKKALSVVNTPYVCLFLDDFFIKQHVADTHILGLVSLCKNNEVSYLNMLDPYGRLEGIENKQLFKKDYIIIPKHQKYGVSTSVAIWERDYLLSKLKDDNDSAWKFEIDLCNEALSESGMNGFLLFDRNKSVNVTEIPVVIQGKYYPKAIRYFDSIGYKINTGNRPIMTSLEVFKYDLKKRLYSVKRGKRLIKWVAKHIFNYHFFTD